MQEFNEFSQEYYIKEFLVHYAGYVVNLADKFENQAKENLSELTKLDKKARNILTTISYQQYKKRRKKITSMFNEKLSLRISKELIDEPIKKAIDVIKKYNI